MASLSTIKMAEVRGLLNEGKAAELVARHYGEPLASARTQVAQAQLVEAQLGF
jgi:hypothetical protein